MQAGRDRHHRVEAVLELPRHLGRQLFPPLHDLRLQVDLSHDADRVQGAGLPTGGLVELLEEVPVGGPRHRSDEVDDGVGLARQLLRFLVVTLPKLVGKLHELRRTLDVLFHCGARAWRVHQGDLAQGGEGQTVLQVVDAVSPAQGLLVVTLQTIQEGRVHVRKAAPAPIAAHRLGRVGACRSRSS